jgi:hypothetical protein
MNSIARAGGRLKSATVLNVNPRLRIESRAWSIAGTSCTAAIRTAMAIVIASRRADFSPATTNINPNSCRSDTGSPTRTGIAKMIDGSAIDPPRMTRNAAHPTKPAQLQTKNVGRFVAVPRRKPLNANESAPNTDASRRSGIDRKNRNAPIAAR